VFWAVLVSSAVAILLPSRLAFQVDCGDRRLVPRPDGAGGRR